MNKAINPISHNYKFKNSISDKKSTCLIMGNTGAGKTCLKNLICGTNHDSKDAKGSVTDRLYENGNRYGKHSFTVIDTPGMDSTVDTYKHSFLLRQALTAKNINSLFIVLKFDNRIDRVENELIKISEPIYKYSEKIVLMISHWDLSINPKDTFKDFEEVLGPYCKNIICYSKDNSKDEIADLMYLCMSEMKPEKLEIPKDEFFLNFNLYQVNSNMKRDYLAFCKLIEERKNGLYKFLDIIQDQPKQERDEILHWINIEAKITLEELLEEFQHKFKEIMIELDYFCFYIKLQKQILEICDSFSNKIKTLMSFDIDDYSDPRNNIKKCPYCGEVWIRVEGCLGETTCGNLPISKDINSKRQTFLKYEISWSNQKFTYKKKEINQETIDKKSKFESKKTKGCGKPIVWKELAHLSDDLLLQLFMVKSTEELKKIVKDVRFVSSYSNVENFIDSKIYS